MSPSLKSQIVPLSEVPAPEEECNPSGLGVDTELRPPVVLVVDDEPLVADTLSAILNHAGYSTLTAYDGPTALELATDAAPELLISDVSMPHMNGVQLALAMVHALPNCKVLLFSGHATGADLRPAFEAGHEFPLLTKPVHPTEMLKHIARRLAHVTHRPRATHSPAPFSFAEALETA